MIEIKKKLEGSDAFKSLSAEQSSKNGLLKLGWKAFQGSYYKDNQSGKLREIDIIADYNWEKKVKDETIYASLSLIVEQKSSSDYHLIFTEQRSYNHQFDCNEFWPGYDNPFFQLLSNKLASLKITGKLNKKILDEFKNDCFPNNIMKVANFRIDPMPIEHNFCAFRETNIGKTKENENSVLWKAISALRSTIESFKNQNRSQIIELISEMTQIGLNQDRDIINGINSDLELFSSILRLYHPIVIIDSMLWKTDLEPKGLSNIGYCRFYQINSKNSVIWWVDIVNSDYFKEYSKKLTNYYFSTFQKLGAQ